MKIKARNIVPGWPRGRSTMPAYEQWAYDVWFPFMRQTRDHRSMELERSLSRQYHEGQQKVFDGYFESKMCDCMVDAGLRKAPPVYKLYSGWVD